MKHTIRSIRSKQSRRTRRSKQSRRTRRSKQSRRKQSRRKQSRHNRKLRQRMEGGWGAAVPGVSGVSPSGSTTSASGQPLQLAGYSPPPPFNSSDLATTAARQNAIKAGGGRSRARASRSRKYKKQKGGTGSWIDNLYGYKPPPGMMGPVPQPSQTMMSNNLVLDAARISLAGQVDSQYDSNVCPIPV